MSKIITCENYRRFGIEIELNTTSNLIKDKYTVPDGSDVVGDIIKKIFREQQVSLNGWHHTNNNTAWIIKPDSSCGIEINSPILKGGFDLFKVCHVVDLLARHPDIHADERCAFHIHVNLEDFDNVKMANLLAWWIKCESVFFDAMPAHRKCHRHAQIISMSDAFPFGKMPSVDYLLDHLSDVKYHSVNAYHWRQKRRKSVEFRIAGNEYCLDAIHIKNWIRLILHFVECSTKKSYPKGYTGNPWHGLTLLGPKDVFEFLQFNKKLSPGLNQVKNWFLTQLRNNCLQTSKGMWEYGLRKPAMEEIRELIATAKDFDTDVDRNTLLYSKEYFL